MNQEIIKTISQELNVGVHQIEAVLSLLEEGNTCLLYTSPSPRDS